MLTSDLARDDLQDLRDAGLAPSDEDVIRLHALARRITCGEDFDTTHPPRFALAGGYVFHEPTMAARMWFSFAQRFAIDEDVEDWMFAFASVNGRRKGYLSALEDSAEIEKALGEFMASFTGTHQEMIRAVEYVAFGEDDVHPEKTGLQKASEAQEGEQMSGDRERKNAAFLENLLSRAAVSVGLTYDDLMVQTPSRLCDMIHESYIKAGFEPKKASMQAHAEYLATLKAIRERLVKEKAERERKTES